MSKIALSGDPSGTGTFTIASPNSNSNYTLTLPANSGTVLTTASTGQVVPAAALPTGSVLQVVQTTYSTEFNSTSATWTDIGLSASITPLFSSSKILVLVMHGEISKTATTGARVGVRLLRGASVISTFASGLLYTGSAINNRCPASFVYLDSPATTSSTTYKTQASNPDASGTVTFQNNSTMSTMTLMEIAA